MKCTVIRLESAGVYPANPSPYFYRASVGEDGKPPITQDANDWVQALNLLAGRLSTSRDVARDLGHKGAAAKIDRAFKAVEKALQRGY